ncbi:hypothetical protein ACLKMH_19750 [Psychromonas sp. KJ10-10]|uniref:hypothetical protein n=1 Tax=Psychromonas sp. KJ10-10 TaxID=3391823 RepID=UPI0039B5CD8B
MLFLVIGLGTALGNVRLKGISFDTSAVIFVAIFLATYTTYTALTLAFLRLYKVLD